MSKKFILLYGILKFHITGGARGGAGTPSRGNSEAIRRVGVLSSAIGAKPLWNKLRAKRVNLLLSVIVLVLGFGFITTGCAEEMQDHPHGHHKAAEEGAPTEDLGICPVMGGKASQEYSYEYNGKTYYFCCPGCIGEFKKDPEKYISKIKEFDVEAYQFGYSPERIEVKKGDIVKIFATSRDVPHGVYIKKYDINTTMGKGETKKIEFIADKAGEFPILCSVYCGRGHSDMKAVLAVEE